MAHTLRHTSSVFLIYLLLLGSDCLSVSEVRSDIVQGYYSVCETHTPFTLWSHRVVTVVFSLVPYFKIKETKDYVTSPRAWTCDFLLSSLFHLIE